MRFGLENKDWSYLEEILIKPLKVKGARLYVFGSRARGDHQEFSDIDILIESEVDIELDLALLREKLEESRLPIKVDLVLSQDLVSSYRGQIEKEKVEI